MKTGKIKFEANSQVPKKVLEKGRYSMNIEEVVKKVNEILKNNEEYKDNEEMQVQYILLNKDNKIDDIICCDGMEILRIDSKTFDINPVPDWAYNYDNDLFERLIDGKTIGYMTLQIHYDIWCKINKFYPEDIYCKEGLNLYIKYCTDNGITKKYLDKKTNLDTPDIMKYFIKNNELSYFTFILGYDLLKKEFKNSPIQDCDINYHFCTKIANNFINSDYYKNTNHSAYEMLEKYITENKIIILKDYENYIGKENIYFEDNKTILKTGMRGEQSVALIDWDNVYVIAIDYNVDKNKINWNYGIYYNNDIEKAKNDFEKVLKGGNLANTFEKKKQDIER